jgi:DNA-binding transcriptional LysR family regulator
MELRDLQYFEALAATGHVGRAAQRLGLSQPALSKALQRLEGVLGVRLFDRTPMGIVLTQAGERLLRRASHVRNAVELAIREAADLATGSSGHVRFGTGPAMADGVVPSAIEKLAAAASQATLSVTVGLNDTLIAMLERGELDLVLATFPDRPLDGFVCEPLHTDELCVVARRGHPLARRMPLTLASLAACEWAMPGPGVQSRQALERALAQRGLAPPRVAFEANSTALLLARIAGSDLLGYQARGSFPSAVSAATLSELPVPEARLARRSGLIYRADAYLSPAARRLIDILRVDLATRGPREPERARRRGRVTSPRG